MVIFAVETEKVAFHLVERKLSEIHIKKSALTTQLVRIKNTEFYDAVYKKLSERR